MCRFQKIAFYPSNLVCPYDYVIVTYMLDQSELCIIFINGTYVAMSYNHNVSTVYVSVCKQY